MNPEFVKRTAERLKGLVDAQLSVVRFADFAVERLITQR